MDWINGISGLAGAIIGASTTFLVGKKKRSADADSTIIDNAKKIVTEYEKLKEVYEKRADMLTLRIDEMRKAHEVDMDKMRTRLLKVENELIEERRLRERVEKELEEEKQKRRKLEQN